jgi:hypothetical protein
MLAKLTDAIPAGASHSGKSCWMLPRDPAGATADLPRRQPDVE